MLSFPEYLTGTSVLEPSFKLLFGYLNIILSLPVIFFSAGEFFRSAAYSLRQKFINIDVPIALGIAVMFVRSVIDKGLSTGISHSITDTRSTRWKASNPAMYPPS